MKAWHFVGDTLRDGSPIPADGVTLKHEGELEMCASGLHASKRIIDALGYAPGHTICRVEVGGQIVHDIDKLVATERTILWRIDAETLLRDFARRCALDVIDLWDAPERKEKPMNRWLRNLADALALAFALFTMIYGILLLGVVYGG